MNSRETFAKTMTELVSSEGICLLILDLAKALKLEQRRNVIQKLKELDSDMDKSTRSPGQGDPADF